MRSICLALMLLIGQVQAETVLDLAQRKVEIPAKVNRIVLGEGRMLSSLAILEREDLSKRLVGMLGDFEQLDPAGYAYYSKRFPSLNQVTRLGKTSASSFSVEQTIALKPDVAVFSLRGHGPDINDHATIDRLKAAGITVVFVDFTQNPLQNTVRSVAVLGAVLGKKAQADEFITFYQQETAKVTEGLKGLTKRPTVFLESRVGLSQSCCETLTHGMLGPFIGAAGGKNMADELVPGVHGTVNLEYLLATQPDVYIGTAIGNPLSVSKNASSIALGGDISAAVAQSTLKKALSRPGISELNAVKNKRAYSLWHHFSYTANNVVALQVVAKWLHPERFRDLNPEDTLQRYYARFQPVKVPGTYWSAMP